MHLRTSFNVIKYFNSDGEDMTEQPQKLLEQCWHSIQKGYDHLEAGRALLEKAEMDIENAIRIQGGDFPEADYLGFGNKLIDEPIKDKEAAA